MGKNDVRTAYLNRWVNSLNTFNSPNDIRRLLLNPYPNAFWSGNVKIPVFLGEYHFLDKSVKEDLPQMMDYVNSHPFFLGLSFFEYSRRYDKTGPERAKEIRYGMYGLDDSCVLGKMAFFCAWWTG